MQQREPTPVRPSAAPAPPIPAIAKPKPSTVRTDDRRVVLRQERLVAAWLRSLELR